MLEDITGSRPDIHLDSATDAYSLWLYEDSYYMQLFYYATKICDFGSGRLSIFLHIPQRVLSPAYCFSLGKKCIKERAKPAFSVGQRWQMGLCDSRWCMGQTLAQLSGSALHVACFAGSGWLQLGQAPSSKSRLALNLLGLAQERWGAAEGRTCCCPVPE